MRNLKALALATCTVAVLATGGAIAQTSNIVQLACQPNCGDVVGTRSMLDSAWKAFESMGTTSFIGSSVGGVSLDAGSLLNAASKVGASEVDRLLRSGLTSSDAIGASVLSAFGSGSGADVSSIVAGLAGQSGNGGLSSLASMDSSDVLSNATDGGFGGTPACDSAVGQGLTAASQKYVENVMNASTSSDYAFSQMGGSTVSSKATGGGMFGGSCIDKFMQGAKDILFKPPQLSQLLSSVSQSFGGKSGSNGSCSGGPSPLEQIKGSMPKGLFAGGGGFFPADSGDGSGAGGGGFWSGKSLASAEPAQIQSISLSSILK
jgi:hypothetical protein